MPALCPGENEVAVICQLTPCSALTALPPVSTQPGNASPWGQASFAGLPFGWPRIAVPILYIRALPYFDGVAPAAGAKVPNLHSSTAKLTRLAGGGVSAVDTSGDFAA